MKYGSHLGSFLQAWLFFLPHTTGGSYINRNPSVSTVTWWVGILSHSCTEHSRPFGLLVCGLRHHRRFACMRKHVLFENMTRDVQYCSVSKSPKVPLCALLHQRTPFITTPLSLGWDGPLLACFSLNLLLDFSVNCSCLLWLNLLCTDYHIHVKFSSFAYPPTDLWTKNIVNLPSLLPSETWNLSAVKVGTAPV